RAESIYADQYVAGANGNVPGYWSFSHGLAEDYLRTGDSVSRNQLVLLAENAAYHADYTPVSWTEDDRLSRENAYAIMAYLKAEHVGEPRRARLAGLVDN